MPRTAIPLLTGWTLTTGPGTDLDAALPVAAAVPGCVHTDLLAAGLVPEPYEGANEESLGWIGRRDWTYTTTFDRAPGSAEAGPDGTSPDGADANAPEGAGARADLVFQGLDTVATVVLNGTELGRTANQHRSYRFPVEGLLREHGNTLTVHFTSPYTYALEQRERIGALPGAYDEPYQYIRKAACNFGWDWGPTLVTSGIWRPVALETWRSARIARVLLAPDVASDGVPLLHAAVELERAPGTDGTLELVVEVAGARATLLVPPGDSAGEVDLPVPEAELWWPRGYGEQPLYDVTVALRCGTDATGAGGADGEADGADGEADGAGGAADGRDDAAGEGPEGADGELPPDDVWRGRTGFRSVALDPDAFRISVNDEPVFVRGVNWIPDDCFPSRLTRARVEERLDQAVAAGANLVRVWGGGLYESDDFYELADEKGLLVWQDFLFACAAYPEEQPLAAEVEAEARENVARLAPHPSLALWCGNNENLEGHADWGWRDELAPDRTWGAGYYHELLPSILAELDPTRPYWPGTPYSGSPDAPPQDPEHGTVHLWDVWNRVDYDAYADRVPRFVAEFGFQGPAAYATLRAALGEAELHPDSALLARHQKAQDGQAKLLRGLGEHLPQPPAGDFDAWHWLTQLNQARAVSFGVRHLRSHAPYCMGAIVWQLNDCWPVVSWAAVDGAGRRKPLWYALRAAYADRLLVVRDAAVHAVNDTSREWSGTLALTVRSFDGAVLAKEEHGVRVAARSVLHLDLPPALAAPADPHGAFLTAQLDGARTVELYVPDTAADLPAARWSAEVEDDGPGRYTVRVTAQTFVRDLALFPDRLDPAAEVDDMLVTLAPGESALFHVTGARLPDPDALASRPVLRCVNEAPRTTGGNA
ncbi:glycoside hydrolase family 2 protein [Streptomyces fuscigenes]|uniref:glycoside hydrolase family 2 protein n=1 Tax=Streptomyces fuscigenes TaxID=1528880 RepID=UPI001F46AFAD|nr:glycoside hydrolase family 2 protein [Streptomyces fuscigenes]MCF3961674.1 glycoside hydrolase family 2 protein [Streptomyces fuscigenes]